MKTLQKYLLCSVIWAVLVIGAGILHTNVILAGRITPEQDAQLSERYGMACGFGVSLVWCIFIVRKKLH